MSDHATDHPQVRIQLMSNPLYLSGVREMVSAIARRLGFRDEACSYIALAVDEALCNVIRHGYGCASDRPIWISLWPIGGIAPAGTPGDGTRSLKIVIEDEAAQVDPATIKSRELEAIRPGGLGVHIIRTVMDEVRYERREGSGMRLTMLKHREQTAPSCGVQESQHG